MSWPYDEYADVMSAGEIDRTSEWVVQKWLEVGPLAHQDGMLLRSESNDWLWLFADNNPSFAKILSRVVSNSPTQLKVVRLSKPTHYVALPCSEEAEGDRVE